MTWGGRNSKKPLRRGAGGANDPLEWASEGSGSLSDAAGPGHNEGFTTAATRLGADLGVIPRHVAFVMDGNGRW